MSAKHPQLAKQAVRLAGLAIVLGTMPGCQSITGTPSVSQVRIIDTSPDAPGLDIYEGTGILAYNLGFGTATSYVPITPGTYSIAADIANTKQQLIAKSGSFNVNNSSTVLIGNYEAALQETILLDQSTSAPSGEVSMRFLAQAPPVGPIDVYLVSSSGTLATSKPILTALAFGANTGYINIPAGTYSIVALPTGTVATSTTVASYTGSAVSYVGGAARTVVFIAQTLSTSPILQAITVADFDPAGSTQ